MNSIGLSTYTAVISACGNDLDSIVGLAALCGNATARTPAAVSIYTAVTSACGTSRDGMETLQRLESMPLPQTPADVSTYTVVYAERVDPLRCSDQCMLNGPHHLHSSDQYMQ